MGFSIKKFAKKAIKATGNTVAKPVHAAKSLLEGNLNQAWKDTKNAVTQGGQIIGLNADQTLGILGAVAGASMGAEALANPIVETGGVISTAPNGIATAFLDGGTSNMSWASPLLSGALSLGGNIAGGLISANSAKQAANISANASDANVQKQINWYKYLAENAHQLEIEDLKKAGLNPILSAGGSTAGAIASNGISPQLPDTSGYAQAGSILANSVQSGLQFMNDTNRLEIEKSLARADIAQKTIQTANLELENKNLPKKYKAELINMIADAKKTLAETQNIQLDSAQKSFENKIWNTGNTGLDFIKKAIDNIVNQPEQNIRNVKGKLRTFGHKV